MVIDLRGIAEKRIFSDLREIIRRLDCDEAVDIVVESMAIAKRVKSFLCMSGCDVEILSGTDGCVIKMKGRNCNCV